MIRAGAEKRRDFMITCLSIENYDRDTVILSEALVGLPETRLSVSRSVAFSAVVATPVPDFRNQLSILAGSFQVGKSEAKNDNG
jgi:hypothetical protein